jgi:uncharacterized protein YuzE
MRLAYDRSADVLYVTILEDRPGVALDDGNDVYVRVDPETRELVGFTLLQASDFATRPFRTTYLVFSPRVKTALRKALNLILRERAVDTLDVPFPPPVLSRDAELALAQ